MKNKHLKKRNRKRKKKKDNKFQAPWLRKLNGIIQHKFGSCYTTQNSQFGPLFIVHCSEYEKAIGIRDSFLIYHDAPLIHSIEAINVSMYSMTSPPSKKKRRKKYDKNFKFSVYWYTSDFKIFLHSEQSWAHGKSFRAFQ